VLVHQAFRFELDPNNAVSSRFTSHCGASRFVYNWGLALVKDRLDQQSRIREAAFRELLSDEARRVVDSVSVPWTMISLRKEWNTTKNEVAPWWGENSKFAYESGLGALETHWRTSRRHARPPKQARWAFPASRRQARVVPVDFGPAFR
jgi:putative transposase